MSKVMRLNQLEGNWHPFHFLFTIILPNYLYLKASTESAPSYIPPLFTTVDTHTHTHIFKILPNGTAQTQANQY